MQFILLVSFFGFVYLGRGHLHGKVRDQMLENGLKLDLSFHHLGFGDQTLVTRLGSKCLPHSKQRAGPNLLFSSLHLPYAPYSHHLHKASGMQTVTLPSPTSPLCPVHVPHQRSYRAGRVECPLAPHQQLSAADLSACTFSSLSAPEADWFGFRLFSLSFETLS